MDTIALMTDDNLKTQYRKRHAVTLSEAKGLGVHSARRDASLRSA